MPIPGQPIRLDQLLSRYGYCSRSEARHWLRAGRVQAAGAVVTNPALKFRPGEVLVDTTPVEFPGGLLVLFHKPPGRVCTHDPREGPTIYDLLPARWVRRNPPANSVGRLDKDATGLLVLTDDGEWIHRWTAPRHHVAKRYEVTVDGHLTPEMVSRFASGTLRLDGESSPCLPARLELLSATRARLELTEGRYHQVKRMFASQGCPVRRLHRTHFGPFALGDLPEGGWCAVPWPEAAA